MRVADVFQGRCPDESHGEGDGEPDGGDLVGLGHLRDWAAAGFGPLFQIANTVWALPLFLAGVQVVFPGIVTSMMLLKRGEGPD
ncbi:hypothetical protein [Methanoculleus nereidis]|uniref:hypothetical protein n=1 Tax=Methanoculleus nereidis TaxID=2735141 RepID=UPI0029423D3D|nr:hypothetical protein [Methanoculleus sp. YWC-01]